MAEHNEKGREGEDEAVALLVKKGYKIHARNWRFGRNELDIVAQDGKQMVFVEVKTRSSDWMGSPAEAVSLKQQSTIVKTAHEYLEQHGVNLESRFDVVGVISNEGGTVLEHIEDAFTGRW